MDPDSCLDAINNRLRVLHYRHNETRAPPLVEAAGLVTKEDRTNPSATTNDPSGQSYFIADETLLKVVLRLVPTPRIAAMAATAISDAMSPYSMAVAARLFLISLRMNVISRSFPLWDEHSLAARP